MEVVGGGRWRLVTEFDGGKWRRSLEVGGGRFGVQWRRSVEVNGGGRWRSVAVVRGVRWRRLETKVGGGGRSRGIWMVEVDARGLISYGVVVEVVARSSGFKSVGIQSQYLSV